MSKSFDLELAELRGGETTNDPPSDRGMPTSANRDDVYANHAFLRFRTLRGLYFSVPMVDWLYPKHNDIPDNKPLLVLIAMLSFCF